MAGFAQFALPEVMRRTLVAIFGISGICGSGFSGRGSAASCIV
jgi:hypothetical protein